MEIKTLIIYTSIHHGKGIPDKKDFKMQKILRLT